MEQTQDKFLLELYLKAEGRALKKVEQKLLLKKDFEGLSKLKKLQEQNNIQFTATDAVTTLKQEQSPPSAPVAKSNKIQENNVSPETTAVPAENSQ